MWYYGVFYDGNYIKNDDLNDIVQVPGIEYYIKCTIASGDTYKFTLINPTGHVRILRIGDFELRDIGGEFYNKSINKKKVTLTIFDYKANHTVQIDIVTDESPQRLVTGI